MSVVVTAILVRETAIASHDLHVYNKINLCYFLSSETKELKLYLKKSVKTSEKMSSSSCLIM